MARLPRLSLPGIPQHIIQTYSRSGTLWEGRYKSTLVESEKYFLTVSRYIELNPVRAGMVNDPAEYPWSSYQKNALGKLIELVTPHACYQSLGKTDKERRNTYRALFQNRLPDHILMDIRNAINKAWVLGDDGFKKQIEQQAGRRASPLQRGGDRKSVQYNQEKNQ